MSEFNDLTIDERRRSEDALNTIVRNLTDRQVADRCEAEIERVETIIAEKQQEIDRKQIEACTTKSYF